MAAGIILKATFIPASAKPFSRYLHYIDRPEAIDQSGTQKQITAYDVFRSYTDYMGNPEKTTGLFDAWQDRLSAEQKADMKELFQMSQEQGGLMYHLLFSFDSGWLKEWARWTSREQRRRQKSKAIPEVLSSLLFNTYLNEEYREFQSLVSRLSECYARSYGKTAREITLQKANNGIYMPDLDQSQYFRQKKSNQNSN